MFIKRDLFSKELRFIASSLFIDYPGASTQSRATSDLAPNDLVLQETSALSSHIVKQFEKKFAFCPLVMARLTGQLHFYWPEVSVLRRRAENVKPGRAASQMLFSKQTHDSAISLIMKKLLCASHHRSTEEATVHNLLAWTAKRTVSKQLNREQSSGQNASTHCNVVNE